MDIKFIKYWYSLEEASKLIARAMNLPDNEITIKHIIDLAIENYFGLSIRVKYICKDFIQFYDKEIKIKSTFNDCYNDLKTDFGFTVYSLHDSDSETNLHYSVEDDYWIGKGYFNIYLDEFSFTENNIEIEMITMYQSDSLHFDGNNINATELDILPAIRFNEPLIINQSMVFIDRKGLIEAITKIKKENKCALDYIKSQTDLSSPDGTLQHKYDLEQQLSQAQAKNAELLVEVESLKKAQVQPLIESQEYEGNTPPRTDRDKLRQFIELIADPDLLDNDGKGGKKLPPYSTLHTRLNNKHRHKKVPSKNTIGKYLNEID